MSPEAVKATCKSCGYTDDCDDVTSQVDYECDYCGGTDWDTTDCG